MKTSLKEEDVTKIVSLYQSSVPSTHKLAEMFSVGHKKISKILKENNVDINKKGAQVKLGNSVEILSTRTNRYESIDKNLVARCKKTGIQFEDANNLSGCLTAHIKKEYINANIPTNTYQRKKYELENGKKWFEEYFDIIELDKKKTIKCKLCDWETIDIDNKTGSISKHIQDIHNMNIYEYIENNPECSFLWNTLNDRNTRLSNSKQSVLCLECNERFFGLTEVHMNIKHNITLLDYKKKWGDDVIVFCDDTIINLSNIAIESNKFMTHTYISKPQEEISKFIKEELNIQNILSNKSILNGVEIDIFIESLNIGIEYNGLYWHSEKMGKHKYYHLNKTIKSENNNIRLIHIFEDEWKFKKDIVKNRLRNILNKNNDKLYARNCVIKEIDNNLKNEYLLNNHIQGSDKSKIKLGAFIDSNLVGVITFSNLRKVNGSINLDNNIYELLRFSSNNVIGLASKFLKYFIRNYNPKKIITYADRRWTPIASFSVYEKIGFKLIKETKPNYWYTKDYKRREHRFNYRKDILVSKNYDINKTEFEIMNELGYDKIWDCGSFKYELIV
jgi:hypothetical protein